MFLDSYPMFWQDPRHPIWSDSVHALACWLFQFLSLLLCSMFLLWWYVLVWADGLLFFVSLFCLLFFVCLFCCFQFCISICLVRLNWRASLGFQVPSKKDDWPGLSFLAGISHFHVCVLCVKCGFSVIVVVLWCDWFYMPKEKIIFLVQYVIWYVFPYFSMKVE